MKYAHNDLISDLDLLYLSYEWVVHLTWNERDPIWIDSMGNYGAAGVFWNKCSRSSWFCRSLILAASFYSFLQPHVGY